MMESTLKLIVFEEDTIGADELKKRPRRRLTIAPVPVSVRSFL